MNVSVFADVKKVTRPPARVNVDTVLERIKTGDNGLKELIGKIRTADGNRELLKKQLGAVIFSGYCGNGVEKVNRATGNKYLSYRDDPSLTEHSGLCVIDLDHVTDLPKWIEHFKTDKYVYSCFISPSGDGLKVLYRIPADIDMHRAYYRAILDELQGLGLKVDSTSINETRVCFISYDPDIYINKDALEYEQFMVENDSDNDDHAIKKGTGLTDFEKLSIAAKMIDGVRDGHKHRTLIKASYLMGGYISSKFVREDDARKMLRDRIKAKNPADLEMAYNTIEDGLAEGKSKPIYMIEEIEKEFKIQLLRDKYESEDRGFTFLIDRNETDRKMMDIIINGVQQGKDTGIQALDQHFRFKENNFSVFLGHDNVGKMLKLDTVIPTPNGWSTIGDLSIGDVIYDEKGDKTQVTALSEIRNDMKQYRVTFSNGETVDACEHHQWGVYNLDRKYQIKTTQQMYDSGAVNYRNQSKFSVRQSDNPLDFDKQELSINPYLLGTWLGDGTTSEGYVTVHKDDLYEISSGIGCHIDYKEYKPNIIRFRPLVDSQSFKEDLRDLNVLNNKHIPMTYLRSSVTQRVELLKGLMDTDGTCNKDGRMEYTTKLESLKDGMVDLLSSLGIKCSVSNPRGYWRISFVCGRDYIECFRLSRKLNRMRLQNNRMKTVSIRSIKPIEPTSMRCISVDSPSKLFLFGKTMLPTHNSTFVWWLSAVASARHGWKWLIYSPENKIEKIKINLMDYVLGKRVQDCSQAQLQAARKFVDEHFYFIRKDKMYSVYDILEFGRVMVDQDPMIKGFLIDPYNSLLLDYKEQGAGLSGYEYHMKAISAIRIFSEKFCSVYVNAHSVTESRRAKVDDNGDIPRPFKSHIDGGAIWANRCDDFFVIHRQVKNPETWMITELHVDKVKDTDEGGEVTRGEDEAVKLQFWNKSDFVDPETRRSPLSVWRKHFFGEGEQKTMVLNDLPLGDPKTVFD